LVLDFSKEYAHKNKDIEDILDKEGDTIVIEVSYTNLKNFSSGILLKHRLAFNPPFSNSVKN
jgi:hypothetical protein